MQYAIFDFFSGGNGEFLGESDDFVSEFLNLLVVADEGLKIDELCHACHWLSGRKGVLKTATNTQSKPADRRTLLLGSLCNLSGNLDTAIDELGDLLEVFLHHSARRASGRP
jgi:hypothetical protein